MDETARLRMLTERLERLERRSAALAETGAAAEQWATREFTGKADRGGITATVDASGNLLALDISQLSKRRHDGVTLGDALVEAVHKAEQAASESRATLMGGLGVDLGVDLGDLFGDAKRFFEADGGPDR
ncbi:YbaB/EbfC family nucleoid-associated protein [Streptosporangium minutum]|uniref:Nucleoid-associated protein, YbaB/EbfC family n=1 Tax=Streptosporangium minutum TaxID=569862 RepID=A0A243RRD1_9ACTN|nr:YbaB/EbfC family nucleoid-associated protein [Streptosporangium minutum]OUC97571.1 hypothetical protein CA984_10630 [Streptosporangium minutum]